MSSTVSRGAPALRLSLALACCLGALLGLTLPGHAQASIALQGSWGGSFSVPQSYPLEVDFTSNGDIFLGGQSRVVRLDEDRQPVAAWGTGGMVDMAVDDDGNVYVASSYPNAVKKYSNTGTLVDQWTLTGGTLRGIAFESGSIYVLREGSVERWTVTGAPLNGWVMPADPYGSLIAGDDDGHVFVTSTHLTGQTGTKSIQRYGPAGNLLSTWTSPADVTYSQNPFGGGTFVIQGYTGVAPAADGGAYVSFPDPDRTVTKLSPTGEVEGGWKVTGGSAYKLSIGPDSRLWMNLSNSGSQFGEFETDGTEIRRWGPYDLPKYDAGVRGEGRFSGVSDLDIAPDGDVLTLEGRNLRVQRFSAAGQFKSMTDEFVDFFGAARLVATTDGGYVVFNSFIGQMIRYTAGGIETARHPLDLGGKEIRDAVELPNGDFIVLASGRGAGATSTISRLGPDGQTVASWDPPIAPAALALAADRHLLQLGSDRVSEFTFDGQAVGCWAVDLPGDPTGYSPSSYAVDLASNDQGTVFVLTSGDDPEVQEYSPTGLRTGRTGLPRYENGASYASQVQVTRTTVYLAGYDVVNRYRWLPDSGVVKPALKCDPVAQFAVDTVEYHSKRRWAKVFLSVPEAGKVEISGNPAILDRSRTVGTGGLYSLTVKPRAKFLRPVGDKRRRKLSLKVWFRYFPDRGSPQKLFRRLTFIRKVAGGHRPHRTAG